MIWNRLRRFLLRQGKRVRWIEASENPWGVRGFDVRPITLNTILTSPNPKCAENAVSFGSDDGTSFIGQVPPDSQNTEASLIYPIDRFLADGVLFAPSDMEQQWALFFHQGKVICVRSWERKVQLLAELELSSDYAEITQIRGKFTNEDEEPEFTLRLFDFLMQSHALDEVYPVPLPPGVERKPKKAAMWCMMMFGNRALFATPNRFERRTPRQLLRSYSRLHLAVARGQVAEIESHLAAGVPIDLLAKDGFAPLHWAVECEDLSIMALLLERGSPVDVRSSEGITPLMTAAEDARLDKVRFLIDHGADVNACDRRGFTSLHRASEKGLVDTVEELLDRGALIDIEAEGETARSLAERQDNEAVLKVLNQHTGAAH